MVLAKARQTEVIEHLYFYQHLFQSSADGSLLPCLRQYLFVSGSRKTIHKKCEFMSKLLSFYA